MLYRELDSSQKVKYWILFTGKKGGALLSALHSNMQHGDPFVKSLVRHTLNLVCMHVQWI